jgi:hypothetical protein
MGKQAKKKVKSDAQMSKQKRHNRATRGMNTKKRGAVWAIRRYKAKEKNEDGEMVEVERSYEVTIPPGTLWDPWDPNKNDPRKATEPYDALHLDWREEMMEYAADNNARIGKISLGNGEFLYRVFQGESVEKPDKTFFEMQSARKFVNVRDNKRRRKPKKVG